MIILPEPGYVYKDSFLSDEKIDHYNSIIYDLPYYYTTKVGAQTDNVSGIVSSSFQDVGVFANVDSEKMMEAGIEIANAFCSNYGIKVGELLRGRVNFTFKNEDPRPLPIHVDMHGKNPKSLSFLYFINNSDGATTMYNERYDGNIKKYEDFSILKSVTPIAGSGLLMNADIFHSWGYPQKTNFRVSLNLNFYGEPL